MTCTEHTPVRDFTGSRYFSAGDVGDNIEHQWICRTCLEVLTDEPAALTAAQITRLAAMSLTALKMAASAPSLAALITDELGVEAVAMPSDDAPVLLMNGELIRPLELVAA